MKALITFVALLYPLCFFAQTPQTSVSITPSQLPYTLASAKDAEGGNGITYQWFRNGIAIDGATSPSYTAPTTDYTEGEVSVTYTRAGRCAECAEWQFANPITLSICAPGDMPIASLTHTCAVGSSTATYTATGSSGSSYSWSMDNGLTYGAFEANTKSVNLSILQAATLLVKVRHTANGCISSPVSDAATLPRILTATTTTVNSGASTTLTATTGAGATVDWYAAAMGGTAVVAGNGTYNTASVPRGAYAQARNAADGCVSSTRTFAYAAYSYPYAGTAYGVALPAGKYKMEAWGAQGGTCASGPGTGGLGGYSSGELTLTAATTFFLYVGQQLSTSNTPGGWNGGAIGGTNTSYLNRPGGGASDVRVVGTAGSTTWNDAASLRSRILVAGGGGGADCWYHNLITVGGSGGGLVGGCGSVRNGGGLPMTVPYGGGQSAGGVGVLLVFNGGNAANGTFGAGGVSGGAHGGGGGGGWYGGGGGAWNSNTTTSGAGGSSFIAGHAGCNPVNHSTGAHLGVGVWAGLPHVFTNTEMSQGVRTGHGLVSITPIP